MPTAHSFLTRVPAATTTELPQPSPFPFAAGTMLTTAASSHGITTTPPHELHAGPAPLSNSKPVLATSHLASRSASPVSCQSSFFPSNGLLPPGCCSLASPHPSSPMRATRFDQQHHGSGAAPLFFILGHQNKLADQLRWAQQEASPPSTVILDLFLQICLNNSNKIELLELI
jgi:hypothetical protein